MGRGTIAFIRYILCAFTLVFVIFGILLLYTGFSTFISLNHYSLVIHNNPDGATIVLLILGAAISIISFLGCCGAITGNDFMLRTFSFILTLLLILEVISVVLVFTFKKRIRQTMESGLKEAIQKYDEKDDKPITKMIDDIQSRFACCGANNFTDWESNSLIQPGTLPLSCCKESTEICHVDGPHYMSGCLDIISDELRNSVSYLGSVAITVIIFQVIGLVFSCMLSGKGMNILMFDSSRGRKALV